MFKGKEAVEGDIVCYTYVAFGLYLLAVKHEHIF